MITEQEFDMKYKEYAQKIFNISYGYTRDHQDSEDIIQNVFMKYLRYVTNKSFPSAQEEFYWLIRVTINESINYLKTWNKRNIIYDDKYVTNVSSNINTDQEQLQIIVNSLNPKMRRIIILFYYDSFSVKEIAEILKISESAVKKRLERARNMIKIKMEGKNG